MYVCGLQPQVVEEGYEFFAKRQLVTIFSAPNYCGEFENAGAMMSVDETLMCSFQVRMLLDLGRASVCSGVLISCSSCRAGVIACSCVVVSPLESQSAECAVALIQTCFGCAVCAVHYADPQACREKAENTVWGRVLIAQLTAAAAVGLQAAMARTSNWGRSLQRQSSWLVQWRQASCDAGFHLLMCGPRQLILLLGEERLSECCGTRMQVCMGLLRPSGRLAKLVLPCLYCWQHSRTAASPTTHSASTWACFWHVSVFPVMS